MTVRSPVILVPLNSLAHGGVERVALRLGNGWLQRGARVKLLIGDAEGPLRAEAPPAAVGLGLGPAEPWRSLALAAEIIATVRRGGVDVLFAAGNTYALVVILARLWLGRRCPPIVLKVSNDLARQDMPWPWRWAYRRWLRLQGSMIDHFVGLAPPMRGEIADLIGVDPARIAIIEDPALDATTSAELAAIGAARRPPGTGRHFVSIGRLAPQKNFARAIRAFAEMAGPDDRMTIVGDGPERCSLEAMIAALAMRDRIALPGAGPAAPALAAGDVFVLSSDYEALPAVVVEALASGLPVVATDCCVSMRSLVGLFGRIVAVDDSAGLAAAMAAQAPLTAAERCAAAAAMATHVVEAAAPRYLALFDRIAMQRRAGPENAILACDGELVLHRVPSPSC
jgi:glycosyltransferase involved in cell wall biosynthesis